MKDKVFLTAVAVCMISFAGYAAAQYSTGIGYYTATTMAAPPAVATSNGCTDGDGGLNYYVKGLTTDANGQRWDRCVDPAGNYDYNWLREYYCTPNGTMDAQEYQCIDGCDNGACYTTANANNAATAAAPTTATQAPQTETTPAAPTPATVNGCTDTDGGIDYYDKGTVTDKAGTTKTDFCVIGRSDQQLREYYCGDNGYIQSQDIGCVNDCEDGACLPTGTFDVSSAPYELG
jgi:hypothetical protein